MSLVKAGEIAPESRVYSCSNCGHRSAMLEGEKAPLCPECGFPKHIWKPTKHTIILRTRDVAKEVAKKSSWSEKLSDKITAFCGSMLFVYMHIVWFVWWVWYNLASSTPFDPYPFGFLTLIVSLEAIVLATFILISQNREGLVNALRGELDYQVDLRSAKTLAEIKAFITELQSRKTQRISRKKSGKVKRR